MQTQIPSSRRVIVPSVPSKCLFVSSKCPFVPLKCPFVRRKKPFSSAILKKVEGKCNGFLSSQMPSILITNSWCSRPVVEGLLHQKRSYTPSRIAFVHSTLLYTSYSEAVKMTVTHGRKESIEEQHTKSHSDNSRSLTTHYSIHHHYSLFKLTDCHTQHFFPKPKFQ